MKMRVLSEGVELAQNDKFRKTLNALVDSEIAYIRGEFEVYMEDGQIVLDLKPYV